MKKQQIEIPEKVLAVIKSDMKSYLKHSFTFAMFVDRNTYGRKYGKDLKPIWTELEKEGKYNA